MPEAARQGCLHLKKGDLARLAAQPLCLMLAGLVNDGSACTSQALASAITGHSSSTNSQAPCVTMLAMTINIGNEKAQKLHHDLMLHNL